MMPQHVTLSLEQIERTICQTSGHRPIPQDSAVATFWVCLRCGKYGRMSELLEAPRP